MKQIKTSDTAGWQDHINHLAFLKCSLAFSGTSSQNKDEVIQDQPMVNSS